jgi:adenylate kinase
MLAIILLGQPGAGKGTQARMLCAKLNIKQISTGDILRQAVNNKTPIGKKVESMLNAGLLIDDNMVGDLVIDWLSQNKSENGYLFDGFPRTVVQAEILRNAKISITHVIELQVADDIIVKRLGARRVHIPSGRVYNLINNPPKNDNLDDITHEPLTQRDDDKENIIRQRLAVYDNQTKPLTEYYSKNKDIYYFKVNGMQEEQIIHNQILNLIRNKIK